jgi:creatinine amidohydrolase
LGKKIRLEQHTRQEFRESLSAGHFKTVIIATGSIEQHLEHLGLSQDIMSSTYVAETVAKAMYPDVLVTVPVSIGIAEHHMIFPGTMSAKPGSWLSVIFDCVESLARHGIKRILILNGHGGNVEPVKGVLQQWQLHLTSVYGNQLEDEKIKEIDTHTDYTNTLLERHSNGLDLRFNSYWDFIPEDLANSVLDAGQYPGHAGEFETSFAMEAFPENVRTNAIRKNKDAEAQSASVEKGRIFIDKAVEGTMSLILEMLDKP